MKIVLTGASSFTGYWFARALAAAGAYVVMPLQSGLDSYDGVRARRVAGLSAFGDVVPGLSFGAPAFLEMLAATKADLLCHHGAAVGDYRSRDYDTLAATAANTLAMRDVVEILADKGAGLLITGSVFEAAEGAGEQPLRAFSPYALSKALSAQIAEYWCATVRVPLGKFVIPNPFGILEEPRFCNFLIRSWARGECATINTPAYVRDNIHVDLLALAYARFVREIASGASGQMGPSGYVETQGAFATRFAREIGGRLGLRADLQFADQTVFEEPRVRINVDRVDPSALGWSERDAWDALADYYQSLIAGEATSRSA